jgi:hypothetical protein
VSECTESRAIVSTIAFPAQSLKLTTVAEGIEQKAELEFLRELGCHQYHGFFFSRPVPSSAILGLLSYPYPAFITLCDSHIFFFLSSISAHVLFAINMQPFQTNRKILFFQ